MDYMRAKSHFNLVRRETNKLNNVINSIAKSTDKLAKHAHEGMEILDSGDTLDYSAQRDKMREMGKTSLTPFANQFAEFRSSLTEVERLTKAISSHLTDLQSELKKG